MADAPELSAAAARQRAGEEVPPEVADKVTEGQGPIQVTTAFIVSWVNGEVIISADLNAPIVIDHFPTADEILGAAAIIAADRTAERTAGLSAETTIGRIEQKQQEAVAKVQAMQQQAYAQQLMNQPGARVG